MADRRPESATLTVRALEEDTWPAFAQLVGANNGVWGGCWCMGFHVRLKERTAQANRVEKLERWVVSRTVGA